jgi:hypothetical protein
MEVIDMKKEEAVLSDQSGQVWGMSDSMHKIL